VQIEDILQRYSGEIDREIQKALERVNPVIRGIIRYHFGWVDSSFREISEARHGKRFRAIMNILAYEAITGKYMTSIPLAASIEMIHNFSLIHDDVEDNSETRRGRPTVWKVWGKPLAVNAGDFLLMLAFQDLYELGTLGISPERNLAIQQVISKTVLTLSEGQHLDLSFEQAMDISVDTYLDMIYRKSASLIECATYTGARLATDDDERVARKYKDFGRAIGMAFQIRDDILGVWGKAEITGKPAAHDLKTKKKTLPFLYAMQQGSVRQRETLLKIYQKEIIDDKDVASLLEIFADVNAYAHAQHIATKYRDEAFLLLRQTGIENKAQEELKTLAAFLVERDY